MLPKTHNVDTVDTGFRSRVIVFKDNKAPFAWRSWADDLEEARVVNCVLETSNRSLNHYNPSNVY